MRILVVGAGGIGGYFGGRLIQGGADVTFLVRAKRQRQLAEQGLIIESALGDFKESVLATKSMEGIASPDIIVIACKAYSLDGVLDAISPRLISGTVVLPLLNGVAHVEVIEKRLPGAVVLGGLAHIGVTLASDGTVKHLNALHTLMFGQRHKTVKSEPPTELLEHFRILLVNGGVDGQLRPAIEQDMWDKFVFLTTLAASTCLMRASIGAILETPAGEELILQFLNESTRVAETAGFAPNANRLSLYKSQLTERNSTSTASMLRDVERGGPTECEHILGDMVKRARSNGTAVPGLDIALTSLQAYEHRRSAG